MTVRRPTSATEETTAQLHALHRAALEIADDFELRRLLQRILRTAARLVRARYAALGVPDQQGGFDPFLTIGIPESRARRIGRLPRQHGVLGALLTEARPIRLRDIRRHPRFSGYPEHHPVLREFLGVPIPYRGEVLGNLFLAGSPSGEFGAVDQRIVEMLAAHAGVALAGARRYAQGQERAASEERDRMARELQELIVRALGKTRATPAASERAPTEGRELSERERDVLGLLVEGLANKEIAGRLAISEKTVKTHVSSIFRKLGVSDRTQAAVLAVRNRMLR